MPGIALWISRVGSASIAIGNSDKIQALGADGTKKIDLGGGTVIPGINAAHNDVAISSADPIELQFKSLDPTGFGRFDMCVTTKE